MKLLVFDLDNTLAPLGKGIAPGDIGLLRILEEAGATIAVCSGKPTYYLCGFLRQVGLCHPILIGENGGVVQIGVDLPPKVFHILPYSPAAKTSIARLKKALDARLPHLWYQPNLVGLTPFPTNETEFQQIEDCIREISLTDVTVYRHGDSFDIVPSNMDKRSGLQFLGDLLAIPPEETVAVGDGVNDYPMFAYAGYAVGIQVADPSKVNVNFPTITAALRHLQTLL